MNFKSIDIERDLDNVKNERGVNLSDEINVEELKTQIDEYLQNNLKDTQTELGKIIIDKNAIKDIEKIEDALNKSQDKNNSKVLESVKDENTKSFVKESVEKLKKISQDVILEKAASTAFDKVSESIKTGKFKEIVNKMKNVAINSGTKLKELANTSIEKLKTGIKTVIKLATGVVAKIVIK